MALLGEWNLRSSSQFAGFQGPNKRMLAPHRAIPIPLIPCVPPGVVGVGLVLALLGTYGSHTGAGPLTDIAAACATDIIGIGVGTRVLVKLPWSKLLW